MTVLGSREERRSQEKMKKFSTKKHRLTHIKDIHGGDVRFALKGEFDSKFDLNVLFHIQNPSRDDRMVEVHMNALGQDYTGRITGPLDPTDKSKFHETIKVPAGKGKLLYNRTFPST